jgi:hypothetical protein
VNAIDAYMSLMPHGPECPSLKISETGWGARKAALVQQVVETSNNPGRTDGRPHLVVVQIAALGIGIVSLADNRCPRRADR